MALETTSLFEQVTALVVGAARLDLRDVGDEVLQRPHLHKVAVRTLNLTALPAFDVDHVFLRLDHAHDPVHDQPVAWERAHKRIIAGLVRRDKNQRLLRSRIHELGRPKHFGQVGYVELLLGLRIGDHPLSGHADFFERARRSDDQVVRHDVRILETNFHRASALHGKFQRVEDHLVRDRLDIDHRYRPAAKPRREGIAIGGRKDRKQFRSGEVRREAHRFRAELIHGRGLDEFHQGVGGIHRRRGFPTR